MNIPSAKDYSIWLMFKKDEELTLQLIIEKLIKDFNSPSFKPHITLIHGFKDEEEILIKKFSSLSENLFEFNVKVCGINYSDDFYKSLYLEIKNLNCWIICIKRQQIFLNCQVKKMNSFHTSVFYTLISLYKKSKS